MNNTEEKEYKKISNILPIGAIIFALIIILGLIFIKQPEYVYNVSEESMLEEVLSFEQTVGPEKTMDIVFNENPLYQFIDLRSKPEFLKGHLKGAINIPISHVLDKEYEEILNQDSKINILYYSDHCGACGPWMVLRQLGYKNNKVLLGGYDYVNKYIIKNYSPLSGNFKNEKADYNYPKVISETAGSKVSSSSESKPVVTPVKKKKKETEDEGGC